MIDRLFAAHTTGDDADCFGLASTSAEAHPDGAWCANIHMVSASDRLALIFRLSGGQAHDAPEGRALLESWDKPVANAPLAMDRACEGDKAADNSDSACVPGRCKFPLGFRGYRMSRGSHVSAGIGSLKSGRLRQYGLAEV